MYPSILRWTRAAGAGLMIWLAAVVFFVARPIHAGGGCAVPYTVQRGDTLTSIALRFGVSYDELVRANQGLIRNPNLIFAGQELCLPQQQAEPSQQQVEASRQSAAPSQPPGEFKVVLEARYTVKMMPEESPLLKIAGSGVLGKRV